MIVGIPGAGIGGFFYLMGALLMPVRALVLTLAGRGREARWALAIRQSSMAAGILAALWGTGMVLGRLLLEPTVVGSTASGSLIVREAVAANAAAASVLGAHALTFSIGTLVLILTLVQIARVVVTRPAIGVAMQGANDVARTDKRRDERSAAA
jgi:hypothetical protein